MTLHVTEMWETISDTVPEAVAVMNAGVRRTWGVYESRAAQLASALRERGIRPDSKVAICSYNSNEYLEAHFAIFKARAVAINVNYRYRDEELAYLLDNADAEAIIYQTCFGPVIAAALPRLPRLRVLIEIADGSAHVRLPGALAYEDVVASHAPLPRERHSPDDIYMLYTGGTTGMPKGVMYRHEDFAQVLLGGNDLQGVPRPQSLEHLADIVRTLHAEGRAPVGMAACPLMHGTGLWAGALIAHNMSGAAVTFRNDGFDADHAWRLVEQERVTNIAIVGDAFARPMLDALRRARNEGRPYDLSSLVMIFSAGVMFSRGVKQGLLEFADIRIVDSMGASEGGMAKSVVSRASALGETAAFEKNQFTRVFKANNEEVRPGSDEIGLVATGGATPIGYYKDPAKSSQTFRVIDGRRYSFPGDFARIAADGSLILLGRGSACINTGGEKVFPEEVEEVLKQHEAVYDCLVVGVPDERFGKAVAAVVELCDARILSGADLADFARMRLAGYKVPRSIVFVDRIRRAPNGKADYPWAEDVVRDAGVETT